MFSGHAADAPPARRSKLRGPAAELMKPFPKEMLYDSKADPHEIRNLAQSEDPEHREAIIRLRAALDTWIVETGDRGHIPESPEVVAPFANEIARLVRHAGVGRSAQEE